MPAWLLSLLFILARRLLEPSTWAGFAGLAHELGANPRPLESVASLAIVAASTLAVVLPEDVARRLGLRKPEPASSSNPAA